MASPMNRTILFELDEVLHVRTGVVPLSAKGAGVQPPPQQ